jgi:hypothetical protein
VTLALELAVTLVLVAAAVLAAAAVLVALPDATNTRRTRPNHISNTM